MSRSSSRIFYGWFVLLMASAAMVGTLPGRTQGLGLITEPLLADLALDRLTYAQINLWATLIGAAGALGIGRAIDRLGSRRVLTVTVLALGLVVCAMSQVATTLWLIVLVTLTRALGQSALSVVSLAMVGQWFVRRIDMAMAIYTVVMSVGFMIAFPLVGAVIQGRGWRSAWLAVGVVLTAVLAPLAWIVVRRSPEAIGLAPDGDGPSTTSAAAPAGRPASVSDDAAAPLDGVAWQAALRTAAFWAFALSASLYGLIASGIGLFNQAILEERGFGPTMYYNTLVVTALTALGGNFLGGWLTQFVRMTSLLAASMALLAMGLLALPHMSTPAQVYGWAVTMGLGGGFVTVLFFSVWPRAFGRRQLGQIQGAAQAMTVVASAVGPLLLAWCVERTGAYAAAFYALAAPVALVGIWALVITMPERAAAGADASGAGAAAPGVRA